MLICVDESMVLLVVSLTIVLICVGLGAMAFERPMQPPPESPAMLRVRIDILQRRIRILEDEQSKVVNEIERIQGEGRQSLSLRRMEQENDTHLLEQLQQVTHLQRQLRRLEETMAPEDDAGENVNSAERRRNAENFLFFQNMAFKENESSRHGEEIEEGPLNSRRIYRQRFSTLPILECAICLEAFKAGEVIGWAKDQQCPHIHHADCMLTWLSQSDCCPQCRKTVVTSNEDIQDTSLTS